MVRLELCIERDTAFQAEEPPSRLWGSGHLFTRPEIYKTDCTLVLHPGATCTIDTLAANLDTHSSDNAQGIGPRPHLGPSRQFRSPAHVCHTWNKATLKRQRPKNNDFGRVRRAPGSDHPAGCWNVPCRRQGQAVERP